jgi:hypothetical protein
MYLIPLIAFTFPAMLGLALVVTGKKKVTA